VKITYSKGKTVSQLDHFLGKQHGKIKMGRITAKIDGNIRSQDVDSPIDDKQSDGGKDTRKAENLPREKE
jgi:hypothetical protein